MIPWSPVDLFRVCAHNGSRRWFTFKTSLPFKSNYVYISIYIYLYIYIWHIAIKTQLSFVSLWHVKPNQVVWGSCWVEMCILFFNHFHFRTTLFLQMLVVQCFCFSGAYQDLVGNIDHSQLSQTGPTGPLFKKNLSFGPSKSGKRKRCIKLLYTPED